jgi:hypothetical protein
VGYLKVTVVRPLAMGDFSGVGNFYCTSSCSMSQTTVGLWNPLGHNDLTVTY